MEAQVQQRISIQTSQLMCRRGCGFYGNTIWQGLCSKCWREENRSSRARQIEEDRELAERLQQEEAAAVARPPDSSSRASSVSGVKRLLRAASEAAAVKTPVSASVSHAQNPGDGQDRVTQRFIDFLKPFQRTGYDLFKQCHSFTENTAHRRVQSGEDLSESVQDFYQTIAEFLQNNSKGSADPEQVMDEVERYVTGRLYQRLFCPEHTDDQKKDLDLQQRIRSLHWVSTAMLCAPVDERVPGVSESTGQAVTELLSMDRERVPQEKLARFTRCSKHILSAVQASQSSAASADDFLPTLVYILLKANPPRLHSNIQFISRFCKPSRLMSGEDGYYFTNLCCAVAFIEKLDAAALNLSPDAFQRYMSGPETDLIEWRDGQDGPALGFAEDASAPTPDPPRFCLDADNIGGEELPPPLRPQKFTG